MKILHFVLILFLFCSNASAKNDPRCFSNNISEDLKKNADAVIRLENIECHILSDSKAKVRYRYIITVLNQRGLNEAQIRLPYSSFSKISSITGAVYKADGEKLQKIKFDNIRDFSAIPNYSLYSDSRVKSFTPATKITPFTISYEYEEELDGTLFLPTWSAFKGYNVSVEESNFTVMVAPGVDFKYKEKALTNAARITNTDEGTSYSWGVKNMEAPKSEPFDISIYQQFPTVHLALNKFQFYKTAGNFENWETFGNWISALNSDMQELPEQAKLKIKQVVAEAENNREKVELVYKYMQDKTHYVNISIGIGGWKPIDATRVDESCYGDCKALSNYTRSLLKSVGIDSYYTLIKAGSSIPYFDSDFVSSQFNHAMLCVPLEKDTMWLECTDHKMPAGFLSTFTDDRYALVINGHNSKLLKTPSLKGFRNGIRRKTSVHINQDLSGDYRVTAYYGGEYADGIYWWLNDDDELVKRKVYESLSFPEVALHSYNYEPHSKENAIEEQLNFRASSIASKMGGMLVLELNKLNKQAYIPKKVADRRSDVLIQRTCLESDTVEYTLPKGYTVDSQIRPITIKTEFGTYRSKTEFNDGKLIYIRNVQYNKGTYDKSTYADLVRFFQDIRSADLQKVLLKEISKE